MNPLPILKKLLPILALTAFLAGCATVYTGVITLTSLVDTAMKEWADLSIAGKTSPAIDAKVVAAHDQFRAACGVAANALTAYKLSGDPATRDAAIKAAADAASELVAIIAPLLEPSKASLLTKQLSKAKTI